MEIDFFEHPEGLPDAVKKVLTLYGDMASTIGISYYDLENMLNDLKPLGYTFDYYLDCVPNNLRKIDFEL